MLQYILRSELQHAVSLVHHQGDQLCIFRPSLAAREQALQDGARLYFFSKSDTFGSGGHFYGHFVDSEKLFQLTPGDYVHKELTRKLADPRLDRAVRASLMGVACGSVQLPERSQAFVKAVLGRHVTRQEASCCRRPSLT